MGMINMIGGMTFGSSSLPVIPILNPVMSLDPSGESNDNSLIFDSGTNEINATAYSGKSITFDGSTSFVDTGKPLNFDRTDTFEFEAYVYFNTANTNITILSNREDVGGTSLQGLIIYRRSNNKISVILSNASGSFVIHVDSEEVSINKWYKLLVTYNASSLASGVKIFIDDVESSKTVVQDSLNNKNFNSSSNIMFGKQDVVGSEIFFHGKLTYPKITVNGTVVRDYKILKGVDSSDILFDAGSDKAHATVNNCVVETGLSGKEDGETHDGIPQTINEEWNGYYYFDGVDDRLQLPSTYTMGVGESVTIAGFFNANLGLNLSENKSSAVDLYQITSGACRIRVNANTYTHSQVPINGYNAATLTRINSTQYTINLNGVTETFNESASIVLDFLNYTVPTGSYLQGIIDYIDINGTVYSSANNFSGTIISGSPVQISNPAKSSDATVDTFKNTIQHSIKDSLGNQVSFALDNDASYIDTNWVRTLDRDKPFTILFAYKYFSEDDFQHIISNLTNDANLRGIAVYKSDSAKKLLTALRNDGTNRINVTFDELLTDDEWDICMITYSGSSTAAGVKGFVDATESAKSSVTDNLGSNTIVNSQSFLIGKRPDSNDYVDGQISRIQFFEKNLASKAQQKFDELNAILTA